MSGEAKTTPLSEEPGERPQTLNEILQLIQLSVEMEALAAGSYEPLVPPTEVEYLRKHALRSYAPYQTEFTPKNFQEAYFRSWLYKTRAFPAICASEGFTEVDLSLGPLILNQIAQGSAIAGLTRSGSYALLAPGCTGSESGGTARYTKLEYRQTSPPDDTFTSAKGKFLPSPNGVLLDIEVGPDRGLTTSPLLRAYVKHALPGAGSKDKLLLDPYVAVDTLMTKSASPKTVSR